MPADLPTTPAEVNPFLQLFVFTGALFLEGRVLCDLWRWFAVPLGVVPIGYWNAMGLGLLVTLFVHPLGLQRDTREAMWEVSWGLLWLWGIGWLMHFGVPR